MIGDTDALYAERYQDAINQAIRQIYPALYQSVDNRTLTTGSILPDGHFEEWTDATTPVYYTKTLGTFAQTTTGGYYRGSIGSNSLKYTSGGALDYFYINSDTYPQFLDLMGRDVTFKCWAYPEVSADTYIAIYTLKADLTAQTLTSTTVCPLGGWTLIELENQSLNDDLVKIEFRFIVATSAKYAYFDDARVMGKPVREYLLPSEFNNGDIDRVFIQSSGYADDICDDLLAHDWQEDFNHGVLNDGTYNYLQLDTGYTNSRRIRVLGRKPFDTLSSDTSTIAIDGEKQVQMLLAFAAYQLYEALEGTPSVDGTSIFSGEKNKWFVKYMQLRGAKKPIKSGSLKLPTY
jgi:hypothetical protein